MAVQGWSSSSEYPASSPMVWLFRHRNGSYIQHGNEPLAKWDDHPQVYPFLVISNWYPKQSQNNQTGKPPSAQNATTQVTWKDEEHSTPPMLPMLLQILWFPSFPCYMQPSHCVTLSSSWLCPSTHRWSPVAASRWIPIRASFAVVVPRNHSQCLMQCFGLEIEGSHADPTSDLRLGCMGGSSRIDSRRARQCLKRPAHLREGNVLQTRQLLFKWIDPCCTV